MWNFRITYLVYLVIHQSLSYDIQGFDDTVLFKINWPGKSSNDLLDSKKKVESYSIVSADNEKYQCFIPDITESENLFEEEYTGPNPIEILLMLFSQNTCSYRLESYWTYELCHGKYIKQYHEERDGKKVNVQQYDLGVLDLAYMKTLSAEYEENAKNSNKKLEIPVKKIDGINMPYVEIEMKYGTHCDLNDKPRSTKVLYVCYENGKQDIYSLKETSTCEYEAIVLTPILCTHPDYKPQDTGENEITCRPMDDAPKKPNSLKNLEYNSLRAKQHKVVDEKPQKVYAIFRVDQDGQDGVPQVRVEIHQLETNNKLNILEAGQPLMTQETNLAKNNLVQGFLNGQNCLSGGHGWWKYEFCFGKSVSQYHLETSGTKDVVSLGVFNKEKHIQWIKDYPSKKPKPIGQRKQVSHFYSDGSYCDAIKKPRQTEVKLKCVSNPMSSPSSISLYLIELTMCDYILGVESPLICDLLEYADDVNGLISEKVLLHIDELKKLHVEEENERIANEDEQ